MGKFADQIREAVEAEKLRQQKILMTALKLLHTEAKRTVFEGGRLPWDTGNLYRSFKVSKDSLPELAKEDIEFEDHTAQNESVISSFVMGDTIYMGYQAPYAPRVNYGFVGRDSLGRIYNQTGYMFYEHALSKWPELVKQAERMVGNP